MNAPSVDDSVLAQIEQHVKSVTDREVGGVLVGTVATEPEPSCEIVAAIPALKAVGAQTNVTFTHEVWDEALGIVDRDHPNKRIVGWYHSHPDFGVFLSEYDLFIQQNFFPLPGMMALVVDPIRGDAGWFTTVEDEVRQIASYRVTPVPSAYVAEEAAAPPVGSRMPAILAGATAAVVAFAVGWLVSPDGGGADAELAATREDLAAAEQRVDLLENELESATSDASTVPPSSTPPTTETPPTKAPPPPATTPPVPEATVEVFYTVTRNDSLWEVAERFYGDGNRWIEIAEANGITEGAIDPGDELRIPRSDGDGTSFEIRSGQ